MAVAANSVALTTVPVVKRVLGVDDEDPGQDAALQFFINTASRLIIDYTRREFKSDFGTGARIFPFSGTTSYVSFGRYQLDATSLSIQVTVDVDTDAPVILEPAKTNLLPATTFYNTYTGMRIYTFAVGDPLRQGAGFGRQLSVFGTWGWPAVPSQVEQACIFTCMFWQRRYSQMFATTIEPDEAVTLDGGLALPRVAQGLLAPFCQVI